MRIEATRAVLGKPVVVELTCPTPRGSPDEKEVLYSPPALIVDAVMSIIGLPDRTVPTPWSQHQTVKNGGREAAVLTTAVWAGGDTWKSRWDQTRWSTGLIPPAA